MGGIIYEDSSLATVTELKSNDVLFGAVKRLLDILVGSLALFMLAPLIAVIIVAIACDHRGPIVYRQCRTGLYGRKFCIYKFRTMMVMEDGECAVQCIRKDPRVTSVGRFLRKYSIDELPQLFNVVMGDMSLVGPRPHPPALDREFAQVPGYMSRYRVKPGMTGLAQVLGYRGPTTASNSMELRISADIEYIKRQSLMLDVLIILKTLPAVLFNQNAL